MHECRLQKMFELREAFMASIAKHQKNAIQEWPIDVTQKSSQQAIRDTVLKGVEEMFESLANLKNWKPHRTTEVAEFDRQAFLEEYVDAFNYFLSVLVMLGVDSEELYEAYVRKDSIIHERLKKNY